MCSTFQILIVLELLEVLYKHINGFKLTENLRFDTCDKQQYFELLRFIHKAKKKKLFGCPPPPTPNFWKLEKSFYCTKIYRS